MTWKAVREWLFPSGGKDDEGFNQEVLSIAYRATTLLGATEIALGAIALLGLLPWPAAAAMLGIGVATLASTAVEGLYPHGRVLSVASYIGATVLTALVVRWERGAEFAMAACGVVLLTTAVAPLLPVQSMAIGAAFAAAAARSTHWIFFTAAAVALVVITAMLYAERRASHLSYFGMLRASQEVRGMHEKLAAAETSAAIMRLSAALAHELSSPIGTTTSAVDTLLAVSRRITEAPPADQKRLAALESELAQSLRTSLARLKMIVNRIQRLTNLDESKTQSANINDLIKDAVTVVKPERQNGVEFSLNLNPVPELMCRPQQLSAVFVNLLSNALNATEPAGAISISSRSSEQRIEIEIQDNGRGIAPEQLPHLFEPMFQVADGRVSTGNWSMFTSRRLVKDHGGDIRVRSRKGEGTTVSVILPC